MKRVALAQFIFESNTFNPVAAELDVFTRQGVWLTDESAIRQWCAGNDSQLTGSLRVLDAAGVATHPLWVAMCGTPAGRLSAACFAAIAATFRDALRRAEEPDAWLLHFHGAVCAEGEDDVEGRLLEILRDEAGFHGRVVLSLDLHANVTRRMVALADAVTAYRTMPHVDLGATGERAARLVLQAEATRRTLAKVAMLIPPTATSHVSGDFAALLAAARQLEQARGIVDVSVFPVQPWMDIAEMGSGIVVTSTPDAAEFAAGTASTLAHGWWSQRTRWSDGIQPWPEIVAALHGEPAPTRILVDAADATTGGSDGSSAEAIRQLWPFRDTLPQPVLLWVVDPQAVAEAPANGREHRLGAQQFSVYADVVFTGEARYRARGRAYTRQEFSAGPAIVLEAGALRIVVTSNGTLCADPAFYECVGLDPGAALAVQVKSLLGWVAGYDVPRDRGLIFDGPGLTSLAFSKLPFTAERRGLYPLTVDPPNPVSLWQST